MQKSVFKTTMQQIWATARAKYKKSMKIFFAKKQKMNEIYCKKYIKNKKTVDKCKKMCKIRIIRIIWYKNLQSSVYLRIFWVKGVHKMQNNLNAQNELMGKRLKFARTGMLIALLSGIGQALNGSMTSLASGLWPFTDPSYTALTIVVCSFICSGLHDFFSGCWILIWNKLSRRTFTEYVRLLKTKISAMPDSLRAV